MTLIKRVWAEWRGFGASLNPFPRPMSAEEAERAVALALHAAMVRVNAEAEKVLNDRR